MPPEPVTRFWNLPLVLFRLREQPYAGTEVVINGLQYVRFIIAGFGEILLSRSAVSPRLPAEPATGSICMQDAVAWQRIGNAWCAAMSTKISTWEQLHENGEVEILYQA